MMTNGVDLGVMTAFLNGHLGRTAQSLELEIKPLRGGLESPAVARVGARFTDPQGRRRSLWFVVKHLEGGPAREAGVYESVVAAAAREMSPALLGVVRTGEQRCLLFLESIRPLRRWPWRDPEWAGLLLERLAVLHTAPDLSTEALGVWDYETELLETSQRTLATLEAFPRSAETRTTLRALPALRRVVRALPAMRRWMLNLPGLGATVIHGDVHTGNVLLRVRHRRPEPVLLDWGRARIGSPLEDVSSWLQSLGYWEPQARRRHDTLILRYLTARGLPRRLDRACRDAYWIAGASNMLAGALSYHLWRFERAEPGSRERGAALHACLDALRIIRRADACWQASEATRPPAPLDGSGRRTG